LIALLRRHTAVAMFAAGFLFDFLTMQRIDARTDLAFQLAYLAGLTGLLVFQPTWRYSLEGLHFFYGGLLSAYVVLYFRSSTFTGPAVFLVLLVAVMVVNEVPRARRAGHPLRLGVYAFCVLSFLTYFIPILLGRMDAWIFLLSLVSSAVLVWLVAGWLARAEPDRTAAHRRLFAPASGVIAVIGFLYVLRLIPPVPMSVQFQGIYHEVRRDAGGYTLVYEEPPRWALWRRDSRPFERRDGDRLHYFARVFAPSGFRHTVMIRWEFYDGAHGWTTTDQIAMNLVGGRTEGFRGSAVKSNFMPGRWRITAETEDGRAIATISFDVEDDAGTGERRWKTIGA
jgi:hypothetical protein